MTWVLVKKLKVFMTVGLCMTHEGESENRVVSGIRMMYDRSEEK